LGSATPSVAASSTRTAAEPCADNAGGQHRAGHGLLDWQKEFNTRVNKLRYVIEQVIANFKTWCIMPTDYRRPIEGFPATISTVVALQFYKIA
jgi:hypothetical protein